MKNQKQILVVEDHASMRYLLNAVLKKSYTVETASNGLEGWATLCSGFTPDLILLDLNLPQLSGQQFLKQIRTSGTFGNTPVIILSGYSKDEVLSQTESYDIQDVISKPFNPLALAAQIEQVLFQEGVLAY